MTTTSALADQLGVDVGNIRVLRRQLGEKTPDVPDELAVFLRKLPDPHGERTAPARLLLARGRRRAAPGVWARRAGKALRIVVCDALITALPAR